MTVGTTINSSRKYIVHKYRLEVDLKHKKELFQCQGSLHTRQHDKQGEDIAGSSADHPEGNWTNQSLQQQLFIRL
ncbi:uncharacterized protein LOC144928977 isoform X2 [Branchiostoma floridae x Branchiostoma belcheri]